MSSSISFDKKIIVTDDGKKYEKAGTLKTIGCVLLAHGTRKYIITSTKKFVNKSSDYTISKLPKQDVYADAFERAFAKSGLKNKGVEFVDFSNGIPQNLENEIKAILPKFYKKLIKSIPDTEIVFDRFINVLLDMFAKGKNAAYVNKLNKILLNKEKLAIAAFHEMGHAQISKSKYPHRIVVTAKFLSKFLAFAALSAALFKRKKLDGEKPSNSFDKTTDFIKNHCGFLAAVSGLPILADEGLASIKGCKAAKPFLDKANLSKMKAFYLKTFLTYVVTIAAGSLGTYVASKVRDELTAPKIYNN